MRSSWVWGGEGRGGEGRGGEGRRGGGEGRGGEGREDGREGLGEGKGGWTNLENMPAQTGNGECELVVDLTINHPHMCTVYH